MAAVHVLLAASLVAGGGGWTVIDHQPWSVSNHSADTAQKSKAKRHKPHVRRYRANQDCRKTGGRHWKVKQGDTLSLIEKCTGTSVPVLRHINGIDGDLIIIGDSLKF